MAIRRYKKQSKSEKDFEKLGMRAVSAALRGACPVARRTQILGIVRREISRSC